MNFDTSKNKLMMIMMDRKWLMGGRAVRDAKIVQPLHI